MRVGINYISPTFPVMVGEYVRLRWNWTKRKRKWKSSVRCKKL